MPTPKDDSDRSEPTVCVVDDDAAIRRALKIMLEAAGLRVEAFPSAEEFLESGAARSAGCAVLDVNMPGLDGLALHELLSKRPDAPAVIILTGHGDVPMAVSSMRRGAVTFLEKPAHPDELIGAVRVALDRHGRRIRSAAERREVEERLARLTPREREVLDQLVQGKRPKTIARAFGTSESTLRVQRASILKKMQADSVTDLLRLVQLLESSG